MKISPEGTPVLIVAGFLGSGKTTFIREILPELVESGWSPYVILNDFLNASIDAHTLKGLGAEIQALAAACVCCDDSASFVRALLNFPASSRSLILIEANGATDPYRLIELLSLTPELRGVIGSIFQISIVNEARWGKRWLPGDKHIERAQVRTASVILSNRSETASDKQKRRVSDDLASLNPRAPWLKNKEDFMEIFLQEKSKSALLSPDVSHPISHEHLHVAVQLEPPMMSEEQLRLWLQALPREILRIKGLVKISEQEMCYFSRTDDPFESPRIIKVERKDEVKEAVVFIAPKLDEAFLRESFLAPPQAEAFKLC